jgi:hypothetical protein
MTSIIPSHPSSVSRSTALDYINFGDKSMQTAVIGLSPGGIIILRGTQRRSVRLHLSKSSRSIAMTSSNGRVILQQRTEAAYGAGTTIPRDVCGIR